MRFHSWNTHLANWADVLFVVGMPKFGQNVSTLFWYHIMGPKWGQPMVVPMVQYGGTNAINMQPKLKLSCYEKIISYFRIYWTDT